MKSAASFTLIELMAASAILSVVLLMMVGMQDQMSRAWANANRRSDATREAAAACRAMALDLSSLILRAQGWDVAKARPTPLMNQGIPFLYYSNGTIPASFTMPSQAQSNSSYFFALTTRPPSAAGPEDYAIIGYYIASGAWTNANGFVTTNFNLYRHYVAGSNALEKLSQWFSVSTNLLSRQASILFTPNSATDEILARNTCNLRITIYSRTNGNTAGWKNAVTNGLNYQIVSGGSTAWFSGSKIHVEMSVYPDDYAQRLSLAQWTTSNNIQRFARSFEFRVDIPRE